MATHKAPYVPPALTLDDIMARFSTDEQAREYLEAVRWPKGPVCPKCGGTEKIYPLAANPESGIRPGLYECDDCRRQFTVTVGTIFESSKVPLRKWLVAWYLACSSKKGISALQLKRQLWGERKGSYRTAWFILHRIRYALRDPNFALRLGRGGKKVEADETWIGGRRRGMGRAYTGNKAAVFSAVERGGRVRSRVIENVTGETLEAALRARVENDAILYTDDHPGYTAVGRAFAGHQTVNHSAGEYVRGKVHTNSVEGYFANLKRGLDGIYHHVGRSYLPQYLAEFDFRYNTRKMTDGERTIIGLRKADGKRLRLTKKVA